MVTYLFETHFNITLLIYWWPVQSCLISWKPIVSTRTFPSHWLLFHLIIVATTRSCGREMNHVTKTLITMQWILCDLSCKPVLFSQCIQILTIAWMKFNDINPFPNKPWFSQCPQYNVGKGEIACNKQFLLFPQCFLLVRQTFCHFHQHWNYCLQTLQFGRV